MVLILWRPSITRQRGEQLPELLAEEGELVDEEVVLKARVGGFVRQ